MFAPLDGLTVVDLTHVLAGPSCTQYLAHFGARVIKIEPPGGEATRRGGPLPHLNDAGVGVVFCTQNTDKESVIIDITTDEGRDLVLALAARAEIFVENMRPGVMERLGLGFDAVSAVRPDVVHVSISAYGHTGPIGHRPAYDHVVQAMSGVMELTGTDDTGPIKVGAPWVDYATGLKAAFATLAAVMEQRRTGEAQRVDVAMLDTAMSLMASTMTTTAATGTRPAKLGNQAASGAASSGTFATAEGLLAVAANNERQFRHLCAGVGRPDLADDPRFADPGARSVHRAELRAELDDVFAAHAANAWEATLDEYGVPAARVRSMNETLTEGQPDARGLLRPVEVDDGSGTSTSVALPTVGFAVNGEVAGPRRPPVRAGADTDRVLAELGLDDPAIERLQAGGVIGR